MTNAIRFTFWVYWLLGIPFLFLPPFLDIAAGIAALVLLITNTLLIIRQLIRTGTERELIASLVADVIAWVIVAFFIHLAWALRNGC